MRPRYLTALPHAAFWLLVPTIVSAIIGADNTLGIGGNQLTLAIHRASPPPRCSSLPTHHGTQSGDACATNSMPAEAMVRLRDALHVMQTSFFEVWVGNWPTAIDWTRAVVDTHLVAVLGTVSRALDRSHRVEYDTTPLDQLEIENDINKYFSQNVAYYFGENAFRIRNEAYDDMLWVVLGWLESVKFIYSHSHVHHTRSRSRDHSARWHGVQFVQAFAHRARVFYNIASRGWDTQLCHGGMLWSPALAPYKNAITNELFISASIGMYLYFPGDNNSSPFVTNDHLFGPYEKMHLHNAIDGYNWLNKSGMTNGKGLYTDGFHISHWRENGTKCDQRNEMVYTYNQGVILSGLRGLWEGTADRTYLEEGHRLVENVIRATGWSQDALEGRNHNRWAGLGRDGVLEDHCDAEGRCSQDAQTFKSIFFHHLALFCERLPQEPVTPGKTYAADADLAALHRQSCKDYAPWTEHNAKAALATRNEKGQFGMWWGAKDDVIRIAPLPEGAVDYRNNISSTLDLEWTSEPGLSWSDAVALQIRSKVSSVTAVDKPPELQAEDGWEMGKKDLNDRGRGRTVETHAGGVAVLRCLWELSSGP